MTVKGFSTLCHFNFGGKAMHIGKLFYSITLVILTASLAFSQWSNAQLDTIADSPNSENSCRSSMELDDLGVLHLLYDYTDGGGDRQFYYTSKAVGSGWQEAEEIVVNNTMINNPYLAVKASNGDPFVVFIQNNLLALAARIDDVWYNYALSTAGVSHIYDPAVAVDASGNAHIAITADYSGVYKIGYGYWDGMNFHFQILVDSQLGAYGSGASPVLTMKSDGSVAIAYRGGAYMAYTIDVAENSGLGGTAWTILTIDEPGYDLYSASIKAMTNDDLHLTVSGDMGWGMPGKVFYTTKPAGSPAWNPLQDVSLTNSGVNAKLAMENDGTAHILFEQRSGNILTGNIYYSTNQTGSWTPEFLIGGDKYEPSIVVDIYGNCSACFEQYDGYQNDDVYYYGYVGLYGEPPDVEIHCSCGQPIYIPPGGGTFEFNIEAVNNETFSVTCDIWNMITLPDGSQIGPMIYVTRTLPASSSQDRDREQRVPQNAPPGNYSLDSYIGIFPDIIWDQDQQPFIKQADE